MINQEQPLIFIMTLKYRRQCGNFKRLLDQPRVQIEQGSNSWMMKLECDNNAEDDTRLPLFFLQITDLNGNIAK